MSDCGEAVERLGRRDPTLDLINLSHKFHTDEELAELVDCLLAHPDVVTRLLLFRNQLTDATGVKLARYLAASSTIRSLGLAFNQFAEATYLTMAAALRVNSSLQILNLSNNQAADPTRIEAAFVEALWLNPHRPAGSVWRVCTFSNDIERLKNAAEQLGHPSLQLLLISIDSYSRRHSEGESLGLS